MTPRAFVWTALAAVVTTVLALISWSAENDWSDAGVSGEKLLPSLARDAGKVAGVEIVQGKQTLKLAQGKDGKSWGVADRAGYPADMEKVKRLLVGLSESEMVSPKTKLADRYALIDLDDPMKPDAKSRLVRVLAADGKPIGEVVLGRTRADAFGSGKAGTYVRRPGEVQTWLATNELDPSAGLLPWVKSSVLALDAAKLQKLTLTVPSEEPLVAERKDGKVAFVALKVPEGQKLKDEGAADSLIRAAGTIDLEDVRKADASAAGGADAGTIALDGENGLKVTLKLRKAGADTWVSVTAAGEGDAKKVADEIAQRTAGWDYKINPAKVEALLKKRADLFAPATPSGG